MAKARMVNAINQAIVEEMERDERVILFGEDIDISVFGDTAGLTERFGYERVRNTPICENLMTGMAVGAAASGLRPICHLMYANFIYTGFDAIANQAAKLHYMTAGQIEVPLVFLASYGGGKSAAAQHSDVPIPSLSNLGGIKVVAPSSASDAKGLLKSAIRDNSPVIFMIPGGRGGDRETIPDGEFTTPISSGEVKREGSDISIVSYGSLFKETMAAAELLKEEGIEAEVVDLRTVFPIDETLILNSVKKTGRLLVVDESRDFCSVASQISAMVADKAFQHLKSPIRRATIDNVNMPYSPALEKLLIPNRESIRDMAVSLVTRQ